MRQQQRSRARKRKLAGLADGMVVEALAYTKDVAVGMAEVHFADAPGLVGWWHSDVEAGGEAFLVDGVHVIDPDRHPDAFVERVVNVAGEGGRVGTFAAAALCALAEKDADLV